MWFEQSRHQVSRKSGSWMKETLPKLAVMPYWTWNANLAACTFWREMMSHCREPTQHLPWIQNLVHTLKLETFKEFLPIQVEHSETMYKSFQIISVRCRLTVCYVILCTYWAPEHWILYHGCYWNLPHHSFAVDNSWHRQESAWTFSCNKRLRGHNEHVCALMFSQACWYLSSCV